MATISELTAKLILAKDNLEKFNEALAILEPIYEEHDKPSYIIKAIEAQIAFLKYDISRLECQINESPSWLRG